MWLSMGPDRGSEPLALEARGAGRFFALALISCTLLWIALAGPEPRSAVIGAPAVAAAALAARATGGWRYLPRLTAAPGFALWLIGAIFASAWAVARRLIARDPRLVPTLAPFRLRLKGEGARAAFMNAVTLTPGTLSARLDGDVLQVHALDVDARLEAGLADLEARVARLYGERLAESSV